GNACSTPCRTKPPCTRSWSIPLRCGCTSTRAARAKKRTASPGPQPRRADVQAARGRRCPRPARALPPDGGPPPRRAASLAAARGTGPGVSGGRPGLRFRPVGGRPRRPRHLRRDSAPAQAPPPAGLRRGPLRPAPPGRTAFQPPQAVSPRGHALRQVGQAFSGVYSPRSNRPLVA
nr:hypothetical protein [Tanacetum cinerariifolium]